jgi:threonine aldolase
MSARLSAGLRKSNAARLDWTSTANEVFPIVSKTTAAKLRAAGAVFHTWEDNGNEEMIRLVTSFATTEADVDQFLSLL